MPIADLLGIQLDMQMLGKLTLSVAAVLLISWAYKFYSSRAGSPRSGHLKKSLPQNRIPGSSGFCSSCQADLRLKNKSSPEGFDRENLPENPESSAEIAKVDVLQQKKNDAGIRIQEGSIMEDPGMLSKVQRVDTESVVQKNAALNDPAHSIKENDARSAFVLNSEEATELTASVILECTLSPPAVECGQLSPTGRCRSPCLLRKMEPTTGVSRELKQDLGGAGTFSSFQSKAEVKVEDGDLLLERPGERMLELRGKIYDYYVESSSESVSGTGLSVSGPAIRFQEGCKILDKRQMELGKNSCGSHADPASRSRSFTSPLKIRDPVFKPMFRDGSPSPTNANPISSGKNALLRKHSYLQIVENSDLQIPFPNQKTPTPVSTVQNLRTSSAEDFSNTVSPVKDSMNLCDSVEPSLETVAGIHFLQMPLESIGSTEMESLKGKLDLGNCLQALDTGRKHGHAALQQAALKVMSDNYLQVLRDPELYGRLKAGDRAEIQKQRMRGKRYLTVADIDPQDWMRPQHETPPLDHSKTSSGLYFYDDYLDVWHSLCALPKEVISKGCAMCTMDNYLFIAVGFQGTDRDIRPSKRVFCYNPVTSIWKEICSLNEARPQCKLVALQGYVYAIGGECLSTVERYDPRIDRWTFVAPLPNDTFAVAHRATACHGEIFVSGGTLKYTLLRYNPKTNLWKQSLIVGSKERTTEMVAVRSFLYRFDVNPLLGLAVYRYHTVARLWYECSSKSLPHCPSFQCAVLDNVIYCVNRQFNMRFLADDVSPLFVAEDLKVLSMAKGMLYPFILTLPDRDALQTRV